MLSEPPLYYWDSCVFLDYIDGRPDVLELLDAMLEHAAGGGIRIVTSTLSIAEVAYATHEARGQLDPATEQKIEGLWLDGVAVRLVEFHRLIAQDARDLIRAAKQRGWSLKPADAIHPASAARVRADEFHTYDRSLNKYAVLIGRTIREPVQAL